VEIIIVVVLLLCIAVPIFQQAKKSAWDRELQQIRGAVQRFYADQGLLPCNLGWLAHDKIDPSWAYGYTLGGAFTDMTAPYPARFRGFMDSDAGFKASKLALLRITWRVDTDFASPGHELRVHRFKEFARGICLDFRNRGHRERHPLFRTLTIHLVNRCCSPLREHHFQLRSVLRPLLRASM